MNSPFKILLLCVLLVLLGLAAYEPVRHNGFVDYDDEDYVTKNSIVLNGLTKEGLRWAFVETDRTANWHPLTWLSHMLDVELFGVDAFGHHLVSLLFHLLTALLLFWILTKLTGSVWRSFLVAALFALHPLRVESVAWAAERKDVLSGFFWMLTIAAYVWYAAKPRMWRYVLTILCFILGLMSKPMLVTLPFVLLLLDYWPLERFSLSQGRRLIRLTVEKIPFFLLSAASCFVTYIVQQHAGAMLRGQQYSLVVRLSNAAVAYWQYIGKLFYPVKLAVLYPHPGGTLAPWQSIAALVALLIVTAAALLLAPRKRYLPVGWFWYLGTLVPVIGLVQVGSQAIADRYTYLPFVGLGIILIWGLADVVRRLPYRAFVAAALAVLTIALMVMLTRHQVTCWKDTVSLYTHTLAVTQNNFVIHGNLGAALQEKGDAAGAVEQLSKALAIKPDYVGAMNNLGMALRDLGRMDEALAQWQKALQVDPLNPNVNMNMGLTLAIQQRYEAALPFLQTVVQTNPQFPNACFILGEIYSRMGNYDSACEYFSRAIQLQPDNVAALNTLAQLYVQQNRIPEAVACWNSVLAFQPGDITARQNLGYAMLQTGQYPAAIEHYLAASGLDPTRADLLSQLAACYAAAGDTVRAVVTAEKALTLAASSENIELVSYIQKQLEGYRKQLSSE